MKIKVYFMILLAVMTALAISEGCSRNAREGGNAPFFDGLYFKYDVIGSSGAHGHQTYTVESIKPDTYKITMENYTHMPDGRQLLVMDRIFIVDENGIVKDCEIRSY